VSLAVPTTQEISDDIIASLESELSQTIPLLPKAFTRVLAKALAGVFVLSFRYSGFIFLQIFAEHATANETTINGKVVRPLIELGRRVGVGDPTDAVRAELLIEITVTNQTGTLPVQSQLVRADTQVTYLTLAAVTLDAATKQVTVRASADPDDNGGAGAIGNLEAGDIIEFANPLPNVAREAVVLSVSVQGADAEDIETSYRPKIIDRIQARPQGGAYADYRTWALTVAGIIHAYPYTGDPGEVDVYVEATEASSGSPDGIPTGAQLTAVEDAIQFDVGGLATRRPVNAAVNVLPITREAFDVQLDGLDVDDSATVIDSIEFGLDEYLRSREPFIVGLSVLPRDDRITVAAIGGIVDGIVSAAGGTITRVLLVRDSLEITAYTLANGEKAKLGTVSEV
jgi:uncharacterized phage protein gp47/JayE